MLKKSPLESECMSLEIILRPLKFFGLSIKDLSLAIALSIRFVSVLFVVWESMNEAFRSKSGRSGGWRLLPPFFIHVLKLTEIIGEALLARGGVSHAKILKLRGTSNE